MTVSLSPLSQAAKRADKAAVKKLLTGRKADKPGEDEIDRALWWVCESRASSRKRLDVAELLLDAGASPRRLCGLDGTTALHAAARRGPLAMVDKLIRRGALSWQPDRQGRDALYHARKGAAGDRKGIVALLHRPVIDDRRFRQAVGFIHAGKLDALRRLLDRHPELLRQRAVEPDCYPRDYFRDPKLFWFIANNPTLMKRVPDNITAIGRAMIARGVEQADLDYTLELVMSSGPAGQGRDGELLEMLLEAGAVPTPQAIVVALAHGCLEPVEALLAYGPVLTAPVAAALDRHEDLARLLKTATAEERQTAFGLAVINRRIEAARLCLDAGAEVNAFLPVHKHSTPLHQAALHDDVALLTLLVERGARLDQVDALWRGTPLDWARHMNKKRAEAYLAQRGSVAR